MSEFSQSAVQSTGASCGARSASRIEAADQRWLLAAAMERAVSLVYGAMRASDSLEKPDEVFWDTFRLRSDTPRITGARPTVSAERVDIMLQCLWELEPLVLAMRNQLNKPCACCQEHDGVRENGND